MYRLVGPLTVLLLCFMAGSADAQVFISSGGGFLHVDNWTDEPVVVGVEGADGEFIPIDIIPAWGWRDYPLPPGVAGATIVVIGLESGDETRYVIPPDPAPDDQQAAANPGSGKHWHSLLRGGI